MKAYFEQNSPILQSGRLEDVLSGAIEKSLDEYEEEVRSWQENGPHTGVVRNVKISGAVISHQASRIGESPSPISKTLLNSTEKEVLSYDRAELRVTAPHGVILAEKLDRDILETPEKNYAPRFQKNVADAMKELF